jgi:hypothetical protein
MKRLFILFLLFFVAVPVAINAQDRSLFNGDFEFDSGCYVGPNIDVDLNVFLWFRVSVGGNYRWVDGVKGVTGVRDRDLRGFSGMLLMKFEGYYGFVFIDFLGSFVFVGNGLKRLEKRLFQREIEKMGNSSTRMIPYGAIFVAN